MISVSLSPVVPGMPEVFGCSQEMYVCQTFYCRCMIGTLSSATESLCILTMRTFVLFLTKTEASKGINI